MPEKISDPYSTKVIARILKEYGFRFRKNFGQNLLVSAETAERIADFSGVSENPCVLEIGTGFMGLTLSLSKKARTIFSMEADRNIVKIVREKFIVPENVTLISDDALSFDYNDFYLSTGKKIDIVANLPFNISSQILLTLFENAGIIDSATLAFQKELADRIASKPGKKSYGTLSVLASLFAECETGFVIPPENFYPKPSVDTCILKMRFCKKPVKGLKGFSRFLQMAFAYRRKTLLNTLDNMKIASSKKEAAAKLTEGNFGHGLRLEDLEPSRILDLFRLFSG